MKSSWLPSGGPKLRVSLSPTQSGGKRIGEGGVAAGGRARESREVARWSKNESERKEVGCRRRRWQEGRRWYRVASMREREDEVSSESVKRSE